MLRSALRGFAHLARPTLPFKQLNTYSFSSGFDFDGLKKQFLRQKDMLIFSDIIKNSNTTLDNINYFKIYKILHESQAESKHYEDFFHQVNIMVKKKSDNVRMLLAKVKVKVAKMREQAGDLSAAIKTIDEALQVLQDSLVPPVMLYYQIFRYYGHTKLKAGHEAEALQILKESVDMIEKYVAHSDDPVASNQNCISQAKAYNTLATLERQQEEKWTQKAKECWQLYDGEKFQLQQYAKTICLLADQQYQKSKEKGEQFMAFNLYQFKTEALKDILRKHKGKYK